MRDLNCIKISLHHLQALTDHTGVLQHSTFSVADFKNGYSTDDNSRALIAVLRYYDLFDDPTAISLARTYLSFLQYAQTTEGLFHNYVSFDKRFLDAIGSQDCIGRTLWAAGCTMNSKINFNLKFGAKKLYDDAAKHLPKLNALRAMSFALMGTYHYFNAFPMQLDLKEKIDFLAKKIIEQYNENSTADWQWFEPILAYCNARIPHALFLAFNTTKNKRYLQKAIESLEFLSMHTIEKNVFMPIGQDGWFKKGQEKALFDQQPIEASCMVEANLAAFNATKEKKFLKNTLICFDWFNGKNSAKEKIIEEETGGCFDGITEKEINRNQGAESTISYLLAATAMIKQGAWKTEKEIIKE